MQEGEQYLLLLVADQEHTALRSFTLPGKRKNRPPHTFLGDVFLCLESEEPTFLPEHLRLRNIAPHAYPSSLFPCWKCLRLLCLEAIWEESVLKTPGSLAADTVSPRLDERPKLLLQGCSIPSCLQKADGVGQHGRADRRGGEPRSLVQPQEQKGQTILGQRMPPLGEQEPFLCLWHCGLPIDAAPGHA